jgi:hypothetical protein
MRSRTILLIVALLSCATSQSTRSQPATPQAQNAKVSQLQAFTSGDFHKGLLVKTLATIPATIFPRCPSLVSNSSRVTVISPVAFAADGYPNAGSWVEQFPVSGCGNDTTLNLWFSATADEKVNTVVGISGTTIADLKLQRDAYPYATMGALLVAKDCKDLVVKNAKFEGFGSKEHAVPYPGPNAPRVPWWETWTMAGCGHTIDVTMDFMPAAQGTNIASHGAVER